MVETLKAKCEEFLERVCNVLGGDVSCEKGKGCNIRGQTTAISSFGMEEEIFFVPCFLRCVLLESVLLLVSSSVKRSGVLSGGH